MEYNKEIAKLDQPKIEFLDQVLGHTKITYTKTDKEHHELPSVKVLLNNTETELTFPELSFPYKLESCDKNTITIVFEDMKKLKLNFVAQNIYWVSPEAVLSNSREYYVRIEN